MSDQEYESSRKRELELFAKKHFALSIQVRSVLFDSLTLSKSTSMTVFSTHNKTIYAAIESHEDEVLRLGDIQRLIKEAGFNPSGYAAPYGQKSYFIQRAYNIFTSVYPARSHWTTDQETYYQLLVPYSPALVKVESLRGPVQRYNPFADTWQIVYTPAILRQVAKV